MKKIAVPLAALDKSLKTVTESIQRIERVVDDIETTQGDLIGTCDRLANDTKSIKDDVDWIYRQRT